MTSESVARRLHAAAVTDAAIAARLRAAYPGRHDVLDALWWRAHPLTPSPAGQADPAAELPRMQAAVYSRTRPDGSLLESERQLRALAAQLRQDETDLDGVLLLFRDVAASPDAVHNPGSAETGPPGPARSPEARRPHAGPPDSGPRETGATDAGATDAGTTDSGEAALSRRALLGPLRRRSTLLVLAGVLVGGIAVAAVSALVQASGPAAESAASASPGLLALFDQPPIPDQTTIDLGPEFRRDSIHAMFVERETSSFVYVARQGDDLYCVILRTQGQQGASVCVGLAELARRGLTLTATVPVNPFTLGKDSIQPAGALADVTIRVTTDGTVSSQTAPHPAS